MPRVVVLMIKPQEMFKDLSFCNLLKIKLIESLIVTNVPTHGLHKNLRL